MILKEMNQLNKGLLDIISNSSGLIHLSGPSGSGKTLFAATVAARVSRHSHVDWLALDGKSGFIGHLKRNMQFYGGIESNVTITRTTNSDDAKNAILQTATRLKHNSQLVVIDPISRVLDMSRSDPNLWGRDIFEDALPTLAGLSESRNLCIILTSEVREDEIGPKAIFHNKIRTWVSRDIVLNRTFNSRFSKVFESTDEGAPGNLIGTLHLHENGAVSMASHSNTMEVLG